MRALYWVRVLLLSFEAVTLLAGVVGWVHFPRLLASLAHNIVLNEDVLKYLMLFPVGLAAWVANDVRLLLHEDKDTTRLLTAWPDYWKLKVHVWVALLYALIFAVLSLVPWLVKAGITTGGGLLIFLISIIGQAFVAASVYIARVQIKEYVTNGSLG